MAAHTAPIEDLTLEFSLKPFAPPDPDRFRETGERIWEIWQPMIARSRRLSVLLWIGTGDEILRFANDPEQAFPWAHNIGFCNYHYKDAYDRRNIHYRVNRARPFLEEPGEFTYGLLKDLIVILRETARRRLGRDLRVGATFDPGPEFADSRFRFEFHREILQPLDSSLYCPLRFITHHGRLRADESRYAGFPNGVPEDTSLGTFLGRQFKAVRKFAGFDFLWLSNGFGYSENPWVWYGNLFDGRTLRVERIADQVRDTIAFWEDLRAADPEAVLEVRGTNYSLGMDMVTDGCSHRRINKAGNLLKAPCNPPWGSRALGLEMGSYLSRMAKTPASRLPFRYYLNDPWFACRPWYDYYGCEPFDILVPMSAARLGENGMVETPTDVNFLSIDASDGTLDADQALAVSGYLMDAFADRADAAGPVVWIYPYEEYHDLLDAASPVLTSVFAHEWFMCRVIDEGLPVNTVCSSDRFLELAAKDQLPQTIWLAPVPAGDWAYGGALLDHVKAGGRVIVYGSLAEAPAALRKALGVELTMPIEGKLQVVEQRLILDEVEDPTAWIAAADPTHAATGMASATTEPHEDSSGFRPLIHRASVSGGGICETADDQVVRTVVGRGGALRAYTIVSRPFGEEGGILAWHRGTVGFEPRTDRIEPGWDSPVAACQPARWMRSLLAELGILVRQHRPSLASKSSNLFIKRVRGAWVYTGHQPDTSVTLGLATVDGAPAFEEYETRIVDGHARVAFGKTFHRVVRTFVQMANGVVSVKRLPPPVGRQVHFSIAGLGEADVTIYTQPGSADQVQIRNSIYGKPLRRNLSRDDDKIRLPGVGGTLYVQW